MGNYVFAKGAGYLTQDSVNVAFMNAAAIDDKSFDVSGQSQRRLMEFRNASDRPSAPAR